MARIRTNKNICLYCFGDLDTDRVCMSCHHKADDTPSPPHHLPQRSVIGPQNRYLIGKALGEGGFGITYLGWDLQQGIKVAVKEYFPSGYVTRVAGSNQVIINSKQNQAASNRGLKRFVDEARALAKIKNLSGVVNVRDFFSANGTAYIVMEFLDGVSLKKYLQRRGGKLSVDEILTIMRPVMESLTMVHKTGLIHRDISPDNIIITKSNEVKLIDFGAAKYSNPDGKSMSIVLKQGFAPPEQYDMHGEQGPWTDVYALGVTVYYAITGNLPPESIRIVMGKESVKRPSEMGIAIEPGVENALMKSLAVDKKKRYEDVQQMMNGLYNPRAPRKPVTTAPAPDTTPKRTVIPRTAMGVTTAAPEPEPTPSRTARTTRTIQPTTPVASETATRSAARTARTITPTAETPVSRTTRTARTVQTTPTTGTETAARTVRTTRTPTPTTTPEAKPAARTTDTRAAKAEVKPTVKPTTPEVKPTTKPVASARPTTQSTAKPTTPAKPVAAKPTAQPTTKPTAAKQETAKPATTKPTTPVKPTTAKPATPAKPAATKPAEKAEESPAETTTTKKPSIFSKLFKK
ncbi:MAG: protein kinase [Clostridiales bacterium]|nr:protein kinase [Clostridiales bacterium]